MGTGGNRAIHLLREYLLLVKKTDRVAKVIVDLILHASVLRIWKKVVSKRKSSSYFLCVARDSSFFFLYHLFHTCSTSYTP